MKPLKDWTFVDAVVYTTGLIVLVFLGSVLLTVVGTLAGAIMAFASTGFGAIVIALIAYHLYKKWSSTETPEKTK